MNRSADIGGLRSVVVGGVDTGATADWAHRAERVYDDTAVTAELLDLAGPGAASPGCAAAQERTPSLEGCGGNLPDQLERSLDDG